MDFTDLVYYLSYGSNMDSERFLCYIRGGSFPGRAVHHTGCRDTSLPKERTYYRFKNEVAFTIFSKWWDGLACGVKEEKSEEDCSHGIAYLITRQQFLDVMSQECGLDAGTSTLETAIDWTALHSKGAIEVLPDHNYGKLLFVGTLKEYPVYTFTHPASLWTSKKAVRTASAPYLSVIAKGLSPHLDRNQLVQYLHDREGIKGRWSVEALAVIVDEHYSIKQEVVFYSCISSFYPRYLAISFFILAL